MKHARVATLVLVSPLLLLSTGARRVEGQALRLEATPPRITVAVGERAALSVRAVDASGRVVDVPLRVVAPRRAASIEDGVVLGLEPGEYEIVATAALAAGAASAPPPLTIPLVVTWPVVERVEVTSAPGTLYVGTTLRLRAEALHADGSPRPGATFAWSTSDADVAVVDAHGNLTGVAPGRVRVSVGSEGARATLERDVLPFPEATLALEGGPEEARTGDVVRFRAVARDAGGREVADLPVTWSVAFQSTGDVPGSTATAQIRDGAFVADVPGVHTVVATAGPLSARRSLRVVPRDVVQELEVVGHGLESRYRTTDLWVFEGTDGRDYALTGSKLSGGYAFLYDVTDPGSITKIDSVATDARTVNDVKTPPSGRYAALSREGATNRRNGVILLDLDDPRNPVVAASFEDGITGGVHNMFAGEDYLYALSDGDKYVIVDVRDVHNPRYVSEYNHPNSRVHDVWVYDGIAYSSEWETGVVVVDVGNGRWGGSPENPVFVTAFPTPSGATHAAFPYYQESTGKHYLFLGDEIMSRRGLAWAGYPGSMGSYADQFDPATGRGGIPLVTRGYIQIFDITDPMSPEMVARYEVPEYGTHNFWIEDDKLYQAYYEGGLRIVDVSGELMGNLYTQGREISVFKSASPLGYVPNSTMVWGAQPHKGHVFFSDTNSGLWAIRLVPRDRPVS